VSAISYAVMCFTKLNVATCNNLYMGSYYLQNTEFPQNSVRSVKGYILNYAKCKSRGFITGKYKKQNS